jgi:ligand-binding SRPBCC domain-containing protein
MRLETFRTVQLLPAAIGEAWAFFSDPRNLGKITPPSLGLEITSDLPARMHAGMIVTYDVRPFPGVRMGWVTEITHVEEPHLFVDEQRFGPYRFWHHTHRFREVDGGVEAEDTVRYALPFGAVGAAVAGRIVRRRLGEIFAYRKRVLEERFPAGAGNR